MSTQIAVRLPDGVVDDLDRAVTQLGLDSRADVVREAITRLLESIAKDAIDAEMIDAYTRLPQTSEELAAATANARGVVDAEPWEKWW
jgi:Arc/MetJ-type ribon-helix-helix transcriptional regulator